MLDTLPERLILAHQQHLSHVGFLELVLADEAIRRDTTSAARRARTAGLNPAMRLDTWDDTAARSGQRPSTGAVCPRCRRVPDHAAGLDDGH